MSELPACEVCGASSFQKVSGFYVCTDCNTQSQEVQEHLFDYSVNLRREEDEEREEVTIREAEKDRPLTSWEMYNLCLKRIVKKLIDLGASPELKIVAFQIWASYLQKAKIAFFSKQEDKLPALPVGFRDNDVKVLYGIRNLKKLIFKDLNYFRRKKNVDVESRSTSSDSSSSSELNLSLRSLRQKQRKLALSQLSNSSAVQNESLSHNESLQSLTSEKMKKMNKHKAIAFKSSSQRVLKDMLLAMKKIKPLDESDLLYKQVERNIRNQINNPKRKAGATKDLTITFTNVISIIRIALLLLDDHIQLGDIMRWFGEGHISYSFDDSNLKKPSYEELCVKFCNRTGFQLDIQNVTKSLGFNCIPTPDLYKLVERYCQELCLPREFVDYVHGIMNLIEPKMDYADYNYRIFPDYENRCLAFIVFAFKLLFSIDGVTERKQSEFADHVNELHSTNPNLPLLFSWNAWVRYIQCRKAILSKYNPVINNYAYHGRLDNSDFYINQWDKLKPPKAVYSYPISNVFISETSRALQKITTNSAPKLEIEFPASLTPQSTSIAHLLNNYPELIEPDARTILENKFTDYSIIHLLDNDRCKEIASICNATVEFVSGTAEIDSKLYKPSEDFELLEISKSSKVPAYAPTRVKVLSEMPEEKKRKPNPLNHKCKTFRFTCETFTDIEPSTESTNAFKIYNPVNEYWFFHRIDRHTTNERFLQLAEENLSESFFWLLKELTNMLTGDCKDLYLEVVIIESVLYSLFEDGNFVDGSAIKLYPSEW